MSLQIVYECNNCHKVTGYFIGILLWNKEENYEILTFCTGCHRAGRDKKSRNEDSYYKELIPHD